jgi:hypothetical protein
MAKTNKLLNAPELLEQLWNPRSRPSLRWLRYMTKRKVIPCVRLGRLVFYDPEAVRAKGVK